MNFCLARLIYGAQIMSNNIPAVTICCIAFKHENYIRECLDGFIMQKTDFPFEVIVHDDASPDKTADIIREYEEKYPDIIKPIYQTENQYSRGVNPLWSHVLPQARGKYLAICEGDDFWCDPNKLQMQYDFMEANPDYSLCMHGRYILDSFKKQYIPDPIIKKFPEDGKTFAHRTACGEYFFFTQTMFIRKSCFDSKFNDVLRDSANAPMSDLQVAFHMALVGNIKYLPQRMAVYRRAPGSATNNDKGVRKEFNKKADDAVVNMLNNSGFPHWIADRRKRRKKERFCNLCLLPLRILDAIADKLSLTPRKIKARKAYKSYAENKG